MKVLRFLAVVSAAPLLLAPVRLNDSSPAFFPPAQSPAPGAYSLPPATALVTPTVIPVSPSFLPQAATPTSPPLNLPQPVPQAQPPVVIQKIYLPAPTGMSLKHAALCQRAMVLVQDLAMLSYQQKQAQGLFGLATVAAANAGQATAQQWPNLKAFNQASRNLPWVYPHKAELTQAVSAARSLCHKK